MGSWIHRACWEAEVSSWREFFTPHEIQMWILDMGFAALRCKVTLVKNLLYTLFALLPLAAFSQEPVSLFDGETLDGWESTEGIWRVEDGAITAGSHSANFGTLHSPTQ